MFPMMEAMDYCVCFSCFHDSFFQILGFCVSFFLFLRLFSIYWTFVSRFFCFHNIIFQLLDFHVLFFLFSRYCFPVIGLLCLVSSVFTTLFSSYWTFVSRFSCFHDSFFQLLDFRVSFLSFSRHCFPFTGLSCLVSLFFTTVFSIY